MEDTEDRELIYWRHPTLPGIKVEEISGGSALGEKLWREMALQIYCENGREDYREIGHFHNGGPFLYGYAGRISLSHTKGLFVVATLPATPEVELGEYSARAALGVDVERADRAQVVRLRGRFLSEKELAMIPEDNLEANVMAWTIKEAIYKGAFESGLDFREEIEIEKMPVLAPATVQYDRSEFGLTGQEGDDLPYFLGRGVSRGSEGIKEFDLYSYRSDDCLVTLAYAPRCAKFGKKGEG